MADFLERACEQVADCWRWSYQSRWPF